MRSGSSLLVHILNTNPEVVGFGETHLSYPSVASLPALAARIRQVMGRSNLPERYVLDKILHNHPIGDDVLMSQLIKFIVLVREPVSTLASIIGLRQFDPASKWNDVHAAAAYYIDRLERLRAAVKRIADPRRCLLVSHDHLIHQSRQTFAALEAFLGLTTPLSESYDVLPTSGKAGVGDPSPRIRAGKILRQADRETLAAMTIPPAANERYHDVLTALEGRSFSML